MVCVSQDNLCFFFLFLVARIGFQQGRYDFLENAGLTMTVMVVLSNEVITPFSVRVIGGERKCFELLFCYKKFPQILAALLLLFKTLVTQSITR